MESMELSDHNHRSRREMHITPERMLSLIGDSPQRHAFWKDKRVLVTGATGLLGSWMSHVLISLGAEVTLLVRDLVSTSLLYADNSLEKANVVYGSLTDFDLLRRVISEYEPAFIIHLGAQTQVRTANRDPRSTFEANIMGTWNVLEAARGQASVKGIIIASSDKAYGSPTKLPYTEDMPLVGLYPYDVSKSCGDLIANSYYHAYKVPVCVTRCSNLYGPGDMNFDRIIPGTVRSLARGETPVIRSDGKFVRDYLFLPDAVNGYLTIAENMHRAEVVGQAFNFSTINRITVIDLFNKMIKIAGVDIAPQILNQASNEIREQYMDSAKAQKFFGWKPRYTLDEGLAITVEWYLKMFKKD